MKIKSKEIIRLQNVLESDRVNIANGFNDLFVEDFNKLVKDYFDLEGKPTLEIIKDRAGYKVEISFYVSRIKPFNSIIE